MRFSVDAHAIGQHLTGNETYVRNLLNCFARLDRESEFIAYVSRDDAHAEVPQRFQTKRVANNAYYRVGFDLARQLRHDRPDLVHVQYTAPLLCGVPVIATVHDVSFLEHPEYFTRFRAAQLRLTVRQTVRSAARVLTCSEFSKRAILKSYGLPEEKVVALPNGVSSAFRPISREAARRRIDLPFTEPFVLTVSDVQPRKNHLGLIAAFEEVIRAHPHLPHRLVILGKETWYSPVVRAAASHSPIAERIHFTGFVPDCELLKFYGACDVFVYPSLYEGFGLPILEAMACGRAVACSNTSAMPEVADSSALLFDPHSKGEMVRALSDLLLDAQLRARMERLGVANAARFSWERTAARVLEIYREVAGAGVSPVETVPRVQSQSL